jgi:hypothetical protein
MSWQLRYAIDADASVTWQDVPTTTYIAQL